MRPQDKETREWKKKSSATAAGVIESYLASVEKAGHKGTKGKRARRASELKLACRHKKCPEQLRFARNLDRAKHEQKWHPCHQGLLEETIATGVSRAICTCPKPMKRLTGTDAKMTLRIMETRQAKWDRSHDRHAGEREKAARRTQLAAAEKERRQRELDEVRAEAEAAVNAEAAAEQDRYDRRHHRGRYDPNSTLAWRNSPTQPLKFSRPTPRTA